MKKFLLSTLIMSAAVSMAAPPQTGFYLSGFNGESEATESNRLTYVPGNEEDEDEGIYRFINDNFVISECQNGFFAIGEEGLKLGFNVDNDFGFSNMVNQYATMTSLAENGPAINCELPAGTYKVILASMQEEGDPMSWTMMFQSLNNDDEAISYYLIGFNGNDELSQDNIFVAEESEDGVIYTYPKFLVEDCADGFFVANSKDDTLLGAAARSDKVTDENPFASLENSGDAVQSSLTPGYYTVNFISMNGLNMISFLRCEDQTPADESVYYLLGFNGIENPTDGVKFVRSVEESSYEDEETGEMISETVITYTLKNFDIKSCSEDGFIVTTEDGGFSYGLSTMFVPMLGNTISLDSPFVMMGIYGKPYKSALPEGKYDINFSTSDTSASISFLPSEDSGVESIMTGDNSEAVYYDLQGRRMINPDKGIYILVKNGEVSKIVK